MGPWDGWALGNIGPANGWVPMGPQDTWALGRDVPFAWMGHGHG